MCLTILGLYVIVWFCLSQCFNFHQGEKKVGDRESDLLGFLDSIPTQD
jgi:hypothetical protein